MEKDHTSAVVRTSSSFIVVTNNDQEPDSPSIVNDKRVVHAGLSAISGELAIMEGLVEDSDERRSCIQAQWDRKVAQVQGTKRKRNSDSKPGVYPDSKTRSLHRRTHSGRKKKRSGEMTVASSSNLVGLKGDKSDTDLEVTAISCEAVQWLSMYPVTNETTHFATVMDPLEGKVVWIRRYLEPYHPDSDD
jgi:hypothetical protein